MTQQPKVPLTVWTLTLVAASGLVAQFLAARAALDQVLTSSWHSGAAAILIEAVAVIDALVLMRSRNWAAIPGLVVALLVSGTYNYIQAEAAQPEWGWWRLGTVAVGPLAALFSVGLVLGQELYDHRWRLAEWEAERLSLEVQAQRKRDVKQASKHRAQEDERQWQRRLEYEREQARIRREDAEQAERLKEERLVTRRRERREAKRMVTGQGDGDRTVTGQVSEDGRTWPDKAAFLAEMAGRPDLLADLTGEDVARRGGVGERTGRRWIAEARLVTVGSNGREADG